MYMQIPRYFVCLIESYCLVNRIVKCLFRTRTSAVENLDKHFHPKGLRFILKSRHKGSAAILTTNVSLEMKKFKTNVLPHIWAESDIGKYDQ